MLNTQVEINKNAEIKSSEPKTELAKKLVHWRETKGWNQKDFAKKLRVSLLTVQNWESGLSAPAPTRFSEIAKLLGVRLTEMGLADTLSPDRIGDRIRFGRLLRGFSIENFANEFGFTIQTVKAWENHSSDLTEITLNRICKALCLPLEYFDLSNHNPFQIESHLN